MDGEKSVADMISSQWGWVSDAKAFAESNSLRRSITSSREQVEGVSGAVNAGVARWDSAITWAQTPSETTLHYRSKLLDFRRNYPGVLVAGIAALSIVPGVKQRSPRILVRNLLVGGGTAFVLLWPEYVMRTAPYVARLKERATQGR
jgi:hypothetical protein